jgi:hypothetical protein
MTSTEKQEEEPKRLKAYDDNVYSRCCNCLGIVRTMKGEKSLSCSGCGLNLCKKCMTYKYKCHIQWKEPSQKPEECKGFNGACESCNDAILPCKSCGQHGCIVCYGRPFACHNCADWKWNICLACRKHCDKCGSEICPDCYDCESTSCKTCRLTWRIEECKRKLELWETCLEDQHRDLNLEIEWRSIERERKRIKYENNKI